MFLSKRAQSISPSPTLAITAKAKAMKAEGIDIIGFGAGEPDFDTPEHIKQEAVKALSEGFTKYTPTDGMPDLKKAICERFKTDIGVDYEPSQVIVSCGAKHSIYNIIQVLCEAGDEVIIPSPYWVSYPEMVRVAEATPVFVDASEANNFKVTPDLLLNHINARTKVLILNSPSNPTGQVYSRQELEAIAKIAVDKNIWVVSDEIYDKLVYDGVEFVSIASLGAEIKAKTLVVNGVSKSYSMTGWRVGWVAGDKGVVGAMSNLQDHSTSNPVSISQRATLAALTGPQDAVKQMAAEFEKRRNYMVEKLNGIPGISCLMPQGAFYAFPNVSNLFGKSFNGKAIKDSMDITELLLTEAKVAVLPGIPFGADGFLRLSYATSTENITGGLDRIEEFVKKGE
ncbi:MAG: pyridoxal phosphate-dependent aminotransferase [Chloroflexota bacterium]|nr:pyridoxal phosphate-dependent aminotransferase [Chloroflexota bacterium]